MQTWIEWQAREARLQQAEAYLVNVASSLVQQADDALETADTAVVGVIEQLGVDGGAPQVLASLNRKLAAQAAAARSFQDIVVLAANGDWVATSASIKHGNFSDRAYFRHHRDNPDLEPFVGPPVQSRLDGSWIITVSRRIASAEGGFAGVALATINLSYFVEQYAKYDLGPGGSIALSTTAGTLLARYPSSEKFVGHDLPNVAVLHDLREHAVGTYVTTAVIDGVRRLAGYRRSERHPLVVIASMSADHALGAWRAEMRVHMLVAIVLAGLVALLGLYLIRQLHRSKSVEQALRKSEEFLDRTGRLAGVGGWEVDLATDALHWSAETCRIHGLDPGYKPTLQEAIDLYPPEARPIIAAALERGAASGEGWDMELPLNRADGRSLWVRVVGSVTLADGKRVSIRGAIQDVTDRVAKRLALQIANERLTLATESGAIGIWDWDITHDKMAWDASMRRLHGVRPSEEPTYELWRRSLHPDDRVAAEQAVRDALEGDGSYSTEFRAVWDDGSVHHVRSSGKVARDANGGVARMTGASWDVTNQRIDEEQRRIIVEAAPAGIVIVDEAGVITLANSEVERIFGHSRDAVLGQAIEILLPAGLHRGRDGPASGCTTGRRRDGGPVSIEIMQSPVRTPRGTIVVASLVDVTERLRLAAEQREAEARERQVIEATNASFDRMARHLAKARDRAEQANQAKSRFLAGMSHELRTPLNGILGYAQLLHLEGGLSDKQRDRVDIMMTAGKHLLQMITQVLDLSEIEAEHVELHAVSCDARMVAEACIELIRPVAEAKGLELSIFIAPETRQDLVADPVRLRQILLNLLGNAVKFTSTGKIGLRLRPGADGSALRVEVIDTGAGVPEAQRQRLFQDFGRLDTAATRAAEGAGLGLARSMRLAGLMGGWLGHDDNPGGGSVFWLELPWQMPATPRAANGADDVETLTPCSPHRALHVLVVDDVAMNRDITSAFLRAGGHTILCADSGAQAIAAATSADFDVVLMDVRMPGIDGLEATRRIRALAGDRGRVPIVGLTAQAFNEQVEACWKAGMDGHLSKPFDMDALHAAIARAIKVAGRPALAHLSAEK